MLLQKVRSGDPGAAERLIEAVYEELRVMARGRMAREKAQTLQPTALVHEAYLRLGNDQSWESRRHFFGAAAEAMRRVLVDRARARGRAKRGGDAVAVEFDEAVHHVDAEEERFLRIHDVIDELAEEDALKAEIVKLRFFVGLKNTEIAEALGVNEKTVRRHWQVAKVRLYQLMQDGSDTTDAP